MSWCNLTLSSGWRMQVQMLALEYINLRSNALRGDLSKFEAERLPRLRYLNLGRNKLTGAMQPKPPML